MILLRCILLAAGALLPTQATWSQRSAHDSRPLYSQSRQGDDFSALSTAAENARVAERDDEAIPLYERALALKPAWKEGLWYLGTLFYQRGRYPDACDLLRRFLASEPKAGPGWALLGLSEYQTREYTRAFDHLQKAMQLGMGDRKDLTQS